MLDPSYTHQMLTETRERTLELLKIGLTQSAPMPQAAASARVNTSLHRTFDRMTLAMRTEILAERLPTQQLRDVVIVPRWATWWDHLKATYARRWWAAWWVRRHPARYIDEQVAVTVSVRAWWAYPHAPWVIPDAGYAVLKTVTDRPLSDW